MVVGGHIVNAVSPDDVMDVLQRLAELRGTRLRVLYRGRNGGIEQQVSVVAITAVIAECLFVPLDELMRHFGWTRTIPRHSTLAVSPI